MTNLTPQQRRALRAQAHHLHPVVSIGQHGLTPQVLREIDVALTAHALVKIRVHSDDRAAREAMLAEIAQALHAAPVQHLGKLLIVWREPDEVDVEEAAPPARKAPAARTAAAVDPRGKAGAGDVGRRRPAASASGPSAKSRDGRRTGTGAKGSAAPARTTRVAKGGASGARAERGPRGSPALSGVERGAKDAVPRIRKERGPKDGVPRNRKERGAKPPAGRDAGASGPKGRGDPLPARAAPPAARRGPAGAGAKGRTAARAGTSGPAGAQSVRRASGPGTAGPAGPGSASRRRRRAP